MKLTEQYVGHTFCHAWKMLSKLKIGTKKIWIDALNRSTYKPRMEYCGDQNGTTIYIRAVQVHSHSLLSVQTCLLRIKPTFCSMKARPLKWKDTFHTGSSSNSQTKQCRRIKFEKHDGSLFLLTSESARIVIETANDRLEGPDVEPRMVLYKQSKRPDHDCIYYSNLQRADAIILYDSMPSALDMFVTFAGEVLFERKPPTSIKPEATPGERIDLRMSGQSEAQVFLNLGL